MQFSGPKIAKRRCSRWVLSEAMARGGHIFVQRMGGLYSHHGIDCGDGSVIHYWGDDTWRSRAVRSDLARFAAEGSVETRSYGEVAVLLEARSSEAGLGAVASAME
jgi:hypothetical protein